MEKLHLGDSHELGLRFSQAQVQAFADISGDHNPLHLDADYAAGTPFKRPIVHGMLSAAVFSKIFGTLFPGEGTVYLSQGLRFLRPVFVDEDYTATVAVTAIDADKGIGTLSCELRNAAGKSCIAGEAQLLHKGRFGH